jgi:diguanylate cyclase (GGDEF)-like protein
MTEQVADSLTQNEVERQILIESLAFLYRSMPTAALGHAVAAGFITYAFYGAIAPATLFIWMSCVVLVAAVRVGVTAFVERRIIDAPLDSIQTWSNLLEALTFVQTSIWGASVFVIWPDDVAQRAVLVTILAGIIATGGIMLCLHRRSFVVYCLPIALPVVAQLILSGSETETVLGILFAFFSVLIYVSVNRLTQVFLELLRVQHLMQTESRTDALTQLANRRGFDENMQDAWQQAIRAQQPIGLLIIDVDYFKNYNDYYGHPQGDIALKKLGELFRKIASRSTDLCARIGGEEFAVLMPTTELEGCLQVAQAIMDELAEARIPHRNCQHGLLTVSIGLNVATPARGSSSNTFVMETDQALYEAKESGRNQIRIARSVQHAMEAAGS